MGERLAAVDDYIAAAKPFARPILVHLRNVVHAAAPAADEAIKWGMPFFVYKGLFCYMAAFQGHAAFGFHRHAELAKAAPAGVRLDRSAMGSFGRIASVKQLPSRRVLAGLVRLAVRLADEREAKGAPRTAKSRARAKPAPRAKTPPKHAAARTRAAKR